MRLISKRAFRDYMEFRDMTNEKLAEKAKCSVSSIAFLRSEGRAARDTVKPATATRIEKALNAPPGSLFFGRVAWCFVNRQSDLRLMSVDKSDDVRNHFVYRYFNSTGDLLYIGCSHRPEIRWKEHKNSRPGMCAAVAKVTMAGPFSYTKARDIERAAIRAEHPMCSWTPDKQREKVRRGQWIDARIAELRAQGLGIGDAIHSAVIHADDVWPDPMISPYDVPVRS